MPVSEIMGATTVFRDLHRLASGTPLELRGLTEPFRELLKAPCTDRECLAYDANIALTGPAFLDVEVWSRRAPFMLRGNDQGAILVRPDDASIELGEARSGFADNHARWSSLRERLRQRHAFPANWQERILAIDAFVLVRGRIDRERDADGSVGAYREGPERLVVLASKIEILS